MNPHTSIGPQPSAPPFERTTELVLMAWAMVENYRLAAERVENFGLRAQLGDIMRDAQEDAEELSRTLEADGNVVPSQRDAQRALADRGSLIRQIADEGSLIRELAEAERMLLERAVAMADEGSAIARDVARTMAQGAESRRQQLGVDTRSDP